MYELTGYQRDLLWVVSGFGETNGAAVKEELEAYYDREVQAGRLYPNLDTLAEEGLIQKVETDGRQNLYRLTDQGTEVLDRRRTWEQGYL